MTSNLPSGSITIPATPTLLNPTLQKPLGIITWTDADISYVNAATNPRGYGNPSEQLYTKQGAMAYIKRVFATLDANFTPAQQQQLWWVAWCFGGYLNNEIETYPMLYADGIEMSLDGWQVVSEAFRERGIPYGVECRLTQNLAGDANPNDQTAIDWQTMELKRMIRLFPQPGPRLIFYCDSCENNTNIDQLNYTALGMMKNAREILGPDPIILAEMSGLFIDQVMELMPYTKGMYTETINEYGDTVWQSRANMEKIMAAFPDAVIGSYAFNGQTAFGQPPYAPTPQVVRSFGYVPMLPDNVLASLAVSGGN